MRTCTVNLFWNVLGLWTNWLQYNVPNIIIWPRTVLRWAMTLQNCTYVHPFSKVWTFAHLLYMSIPRPDERGQVRVGRWNGPEHLQNDPLRFLLYIGIAQKLLTATKLCSPSLWACVVGAPWGRRSRQSSSSCCVDTCTEVRLREQMYARHESVTICARWSTFLRVISGLW